MATYKKQLKDQNGDNIIPALGTATVTGTNIDWSTFVQIGTAQVEYQANNTAGGFVAVTFDTPFAYTPVVFAQDLLGNGYVSSLTVSNVTTTGFRLLARCMYSSSAGTATVNWIAFSPQG